MHVMIDFLSYQPYVTVAYCLVVVLRQELKFLAEWMIRKEGTWLETERERGRQEAFFCSCGRLFDYADRARLLSVASWGVVCCHGFISTAARTTLIQLQLWTIRAKLPTKTLSVQQNHDYAAFSLQDR